MAEEGCKKINTCNFNTVKEAYLNNCDFMHTGYLDHVSSAHGIWVFRATDFPLSFPFRTGG